MSKLTLMLDDTGKSFEVRRGDIITIQLKENRTTPYRWKLKSDTETHILPLQDSRYSLPKEPKFGEDGVLTLTFKAISVGTASIQLKHWCEWEGESSVSDRFDVSISVVD
ncbi:protease inhibitor I42 family protein [Psychromonas ingrahamii]|uniref:protease inhibitor I42 family protein n=1 Tax=Psychromonas ingrahamii TaxID=357794 RepID=UPI0002EA1487|nr:protease inhibitor I42 family protein [Psychromonas ingrahamii]